MSALAHGDVTRVVKTKYPVIPLLMGEWGKKLLIEDGALFRIANLPKLTHCSQPPEKHRLMVLESLHADSGHRGFDKICGCSTVSYTQWWAAGSCVQGFPVRWARFKYHSKCPGSSRSLYEVPVKPFRQKIRKPPRSQKSCGGGISTNSFELSAPTHPHTLIQFKVSLPRVLYFVHGFINFLGVLLCLPIVGFVAHYCGS